jgi:uncharacterized protein (TIGR00255 family)
VEIDLLLSMTGHGQAAAANDQAQVTVEIRSVNNRFLKLNVYSDLNSQFQSKLESQVKASINRGSVSVRVSTLLQKSDQDYALNKEAINAYWLQLSEIAGGSQTVGIESVMNLPGIVAEAGRTDRSEILWPLVQTAVTDALENLAQMRLQEGTAMSEDMLGNCKKIEAQLSAIEKLAPRMVDAYTKKMTDRINSMLEKFEVSITASDIIKEVGVFAERCDISEEVVRLGNHIRQFNQVVALPESNGKKLEFLVQEMLRETNTIGSKSNDSDIANHVVEIKTAIERIREMVQNVE